MPRWATKPGSRWCIASVQPACDFEKGRKNLNSGESTLESVAKRALDCRVAHRQLIAFSDQRRLYTYLAERDLQ